MKIRDIMEGDVVTLKPMNSMKDAVNMLRESHVSGAPVIVDGDMVGIITEHDIFQYFEGHVPQRIIDQRLCTSLDLIEIIREIITSENRLPTRRMKNFLSTSVNEVMQEEVYTVSADEDMGKVLDLMSRRGVNHVPVTEEGELVGIVAREDVIKGLSKTI